MSGRDHFARRLWARCRVVLLAPVILLGGLVVGVVVGILGIAEAVDDATRD